MKLSTKGRYAITAMLDLALNANQGNRVTLADISTFQGISLSYLEQLFAHLRNAKLVSGTRGPGGGYRLARPTNEISIAEIITAIDEPSTKEKIMKLDERHQKSQQLWEKLNGHINNYLSSITLADLMCDNNESSSSTTFQSGTKIEPLDIWPAHPHKHTRI